MDNTYKHKVSITELKRQKIIIITATEKIG